MVLSFRIFKTPGLRTPAVNERVYTISANGSPLADSSDVFITVPVGGGEVNHSDNVCAEGVACGFSGLLPVSVIRSHFSSCAAAGHQGTDLG